MNGSIWQKQPQVIGHFKTLSLVVAFSILLSFAAASGDSRPDAMPGAVKQAFQSRLGQRQAEIKELYGVPPFQIPQQRRSLPQEQFRKTASSVAAGPAKTISDNFNDGTIDTSIWLANFGTGSITESGGVLAMYCNSTNSSFVQTSPKIWSNGNDIEVSVDFSNRSVSGPGLAESALLLYIGSGLAAVDIVTSGGTPYTAFMASDGTASTATWTTSAGASGKLKIIYRYSTRVVEGYLDSGSGWIPLGNSGQLQMTAAEGAWFLLMAGVANSSTQINIHFDNFLAQGNDYVLPQLGEVGIFAQLTYTFSGYRRDFRMVVPENYTPSRPMGVVYGFHGGGLRSKGTPPSLGYLSSRGFEAKRKEAYWICVSLAQREGAGWSNVLNSSNVDAQAVQEIDALLKTYYSIDSDRVYATGFSAGGGMTMFLPHALPNFLAAIAPECPVPHTLPPQGATFGCIGTGGLSDTTWGSTAEKMVNTSEWYRQAGVDADCHVFNMGHSYPQNDSTVSPAIAWRDKMADYFQTRPRNYTSSPNLVLAPHLYAQGFRDEFDGALPVPSAERWRVSLFDSNGVLYGASDSAASGLHGYKFRVENGYAQSESIGNAQNGGLCASRFIRYPLAWRTAFMASAGETDLKIWPLVLTDMRGRVLALNIGKNGWAWESYPTRLAFRAINSSHQAPRNGTLALQMGTEYFLEVIFSASDLTWTLSNASQTCANGSISASPYIMGPLEAGFGLFGTNASAKFGYAELSEAPLANSEIWYQYK